jgi:hypothetical protein
MTKPNWIFIKRAVVLSAAAIVLLFIPIIAGSIWFHAQGWRNLMRHEGNFDAAVFFGELLLIAAAILCWRAALRFANLPEEARQLELKDRLQFENDLRANRIQVITTVVQALGGIAVLVGIYFAWANLKLTQKAQQDTVRLTNEGQITDRFVRAIDQLGATDKDGKQAIEIRLGGIYGLTRIAHDSPKDYLPIRHILIAYVLLNAQPTELSSTERAALNYCPPRMDTNVYPRTDIQAAITFLGQGPTIAEPLDLHNTQLRGANLQEANLRNAYLAGVDLRLGWLPNAHLECARLIDAHMEGAYLEGAHLEGVLLEGTNLDCTDWKNAHLEGALLSAADLRRALDLTQKQVDLAYGSGATKLPFGIHMPESWKTSPPRSTCN